jgi:hypothetical protein
MIILNDKRFNDEKFHFVKNLEAIKKSPNNSTLIFNYKESDIDLYRFCQKNSIEYGVKISSIKEFIFLINLGAKYCFCDTLKLAKKLQKIADNYLTETKVILISSLNRIEKVALNGIDGIILDIFSKEI